VNSKSENTTDTLGRIFNAIPSVFGFLLMGGMIGAFLWMMQVGLGQIPSWVLAVSVFLVSVTCSVCAKMQDYSALITTALIFVVNIFINFLYVGQPEISDAVNPLAGAGQRFVGYLPLVAAIGGLGFALEKFRMRKLGN